MEKEIITTGKVNSYAEDLFIELFCDVFGPENSQYIFVQYPFTDIYGETYHNPSKISNNKYYDDLLKQN